MSGRATGGPAPDRDELAAEYLLGLLDPEQARAIARAVERDPALAGAVEGWAARLEPLAALAAPVPPSDMLWQRIARDLPARAAPPAPAAAVSRPSAGRLAGRVLGLGGYCVAAGLAAALLLSRHRLDVHIAWDMPSSLSVAPAPGRLPASPPPAAAPPATPHPVAPVAASPAPPASNASLNPSPVGDLHGRAVALLTAGGGERPAMKAYFVQGGLVRLVLLQSMSVPADRQLGFWVWPRGTALPIPLGRLDPEGGTLRFPYHEADGTPVMVTLEPRLLPFTGAQGPTLLTGQLVTVD